jgi:hypothetical protein
MHKQLILLLGIISIGMSQGLGELKLLYTFEEVSALVDTMIDEGIVAGAHNFSATNYNEPDVVWRLAFSENLLVALSASKSNCTEDMWKNDWLQYKETLVCISQNWDYPTRESPQWKAQWKIARDGDKPPHYFMTSFNINSKIMESAVVLDVD